MFVSPLCSLFCLTWFPVTSIFLQMSWFLSSWLQKVPLCIWITFSSVDGHLDWPIPVYCEQCCSVCGCVSVSGMFYTPSCLGRSYGCFSFFFSLRSLHVDFHCSSTRCTPAVNNSFPSSTHILPCDFCSLFSWLLG